MSEDIQEAAPEAPVITVNGVDITYACTIDFENHHITLPDNLPGGSAVYVDGVWLLTTPIELEDRSKHVVADFKRRGLTLKPLCVAIRAALLIEGSAL